MGRSSAAERRPLEILRRPEGGAGETRPVFVSPADPAKATREVVATLHELIETLTELANERPRDADTDRDKDRPLLLNAIETGRLLSISRAKVLNMAARGELPSIHVGGSVRIPRDRLVEWIADNSALPNAQVARRLGWANSREES
jgi:excisionase family DNA binding protein